MKPSGRLMALAAIAAAMGGDGLSHSVEPREAIPRKSEAEINTAKGLILFRYGPDNSVWAINQKNADRKAKKLGYIV